MRDVFSQGGVLVVWTERKLAWPADSGTGRSDSETVRTLSDMVRSVEG